jgi:hypothetical protein
VHSKCASGSSDSEGGVRWAVARERIKHFRDAIGLAIQRNFRSTFRHAQAGTSAGWTKPTHTHARVRVIYAPMERLGKILQGRFSICGDSCGEYSNAHLRFGVDVRGGSIVGTSGDIKGSAAANNYRRQESKGGTGSRMDPLRKGSVPRVSPRQCGARKNLNVCGRRN